MATNGYHIFFDPEWTASLRDEEISAVIAHEVLHVVFGHSDRMLGRKQSIWNVACDYAINYFLSLQGMSLPKDGLIDKSFAGKTAEEIYDELTSDQRHSGLLKQLTKVGYLDLLHPDDTRIRQHQDGDSPDSEQRRQLRATLGSDMKSKIHGMSIGLFNGELGVATSRQINWQVLLRMWLTERIRTDWRTFPFSKKHLSRGFYMPSLGLDIPGHVYFAIDTSGSMTDKEISVIAGELRSFRESFPCLLTIVQCDTQIQSLQRHDAEDSFDLPERIKLKGRGGTDFRPVFELIAQEVSTPSPILIFATDGYGEFPKLNPCYPCVWVLTPRGVQKQQIPFGTVVRLMH